MTFGPVTSKQPMWLTSNSPAALRTAACSSLTLLYQTGISQPAKGTILPPVALWVSNRAVRLGGASFGFVQIHSFLLD